MESVDAVFFDLDNTLVDYNKSDIIGLKALLKTLPADIDETLFIDLAVKESVIFHELADKEEVDRTNLHRFRLFNTLKYFNITWEEKYLASFWEANINSISCFMDVKEVLGYLKERTFVGIVSNAFNPGEQRKKLAKLNFAYYVDEIVLCSELGIYKPAKEAFLYLINKHGFEVSSCIYVGDSEKYDVKGAKNAGLFAIKLNKQKGESVADYHCSNLRELQQYFQRRGSFDDQKR